MNDTQMDISVVIPLYNKKDTIRRAIDSIVNQTYQPQEIIIVNDGSKDGSEEVVEEFNHPLIRLIHQENAGVSAARNRGIDEARFEWVALLDADDEWLPEYLFSITQMQVHFNADVLATSYYLKSESEHKKIILNNIEFENKTGMMNNYFEVASASNPPICSSAVVVRKKCLKEIGGFPLGVKTGEDLLTWATLASKFEIAYCLKPLSVFYLENSQTYDAKPKRVPEYNDPVFMGLLNVYNQNKEMAGLKKYIAHWKLMRANIFMRLGENHKSLKETFTALKFHPSNIKAYAFIVIAIFPLRDKNKIFKFLSKR